MIEIGCKRLIDNAILPTKAYAYDAGWDLYSIEHVTIKPEERASIKTGICLEIPNGYVGLIWPRSGLSVKNGIDVLAGVIDSGYRGEIIVCLYNTDSSKELLLPAGSKIAQIIIQEIPMSIMTEAFGLSDSDRGRKGFGSSG